MVALWQPLGQASPRPGTSPELLWPILGLAGILLLGTAAILWVKHWRAGLGQEREMLEEELARYEGLLARGDLSREEFERITSVLRGRPPEGGSPPAPGPSGG